MAPSNVVGDIAAFTNFCGAEPTGRTFVVDLAHQTILANVPGAIHQSQAMSDDGDRIFDRMPLGSWMVHFASTTPVPARCWWNSRT